MYWHYPVGWRMQGQRPTVCSCEHTVSAPAISLIHVCQDGPRPSRPSSRGLHWNLIILIPVIGSRLIWKETTLKSDSILYSQNCALSKIISFSFIWHSHNKTRVHDVTPKAVAEESWRWRIFLNACRNKYFKEYVHLKFVIYGPGRDFSISRIFDFPECLGYYYLVHTRLHEYILSM